MQIIDRDDTEKIEFTDGTVVYYNAMEVREFNTLAALRTELGEDMLIYDLELLRMKYLKKFKDRYMNARVYSG